MPEEKTRKKFDEPDNKDEDKGKSEKTSEATKYSRTNTESKIGEENEKNSKVIETEGANKSESYIGERKGHSRIEQGERSVSPEKHMRNRAGSSESPSQGKSVSGIGGNKTSFDLEKAGSNGIGFQEEILGGRESKDKRRYEPNANVNMTDDLPRTRDYGMKHSSENGDNRFKHSYEPNNYNKEEKERISARNGETSSARIPDTSGRSVDSKGQNYRNYSSKESSSDFITPKTDPYKSPVSFTPQASSLENRERYFNHKDLSDRGNYGNSNTRYARRPDNWKMPNTRPFSNGSFGGAGPDEVEISPYLNPDWKFPSGSAGQDQVEWKTFHYEKPRRPTYDPDLHLDPIVDESLVSEEWQSFPRPMYTDHESQLNRFREPIRVKLHPNLKNGGIVEPGQLAADWATQKARWDEEEEVRSQARLQTLEKTKQSLQDMKLESQRKVEEKRVKREAIIEEFSRKMQEIEDSKPAPEAIPGMPAVLTIPSKGYSYFTDEASQTLSVVIEKL